MIYLPQATIFPEYLFVDPVFPSVSLGSGVGVECCHQLIRLFLTNQPLCLLPEEEIRKGEVLSWATGLPGQTCTCLHGQQPQIPFLGVKSATHCTTTTASKQATGKTHSLEIGG
jgi:hypothetical protein